MPDVLIRDVPAEDLDVIRAAAATQGVSLQSYLRATMHAQAGYLRRQEALEHAARRLRGRPDVPEAERAAVLDAIAAEHDRRADQLGNRPR
ncbi:MAG TPA: hypothetical protein VKP11_04440 [Frankiaceae bacterium]|nr:hypothetical protein [Frankiaceae bacterium]